MLLFYRGGNARRCKLRLTGRELREFPNAIEGCTSDAIQNIDCYTIDSAEIEIQGIWTLYSTIIL